MALLLLLPELRRKKASCTYSGRWGRAVRERRYRRESYPPALMNLPHGYDANRDNWHAKQCCSLAELC
ncbi:hypothetical protein E2562_006472 [Oryza meyeriana var. granulata]|uniref:Uncharacterized protein n=1 Tax=Oryza meyeriana var. granulata TaxID=110450 RepID=A0A6G1CNV5_9ORYZ|nr:hypothetical protein E2562_006472 [Oryza meyeriana var. granulata]